MSDCTVEVDIDQTRQGVIAFGVQHFLVFLRGRAKHDAPVTDHKVFFHKTAAVCKNFGIFDNHSGKPPAIRSG